MPATPPAAVASAHVAAALAAIGVKPPASAKAPNSIDFTPGSRAIRDQHLNLRLDGILEERYSLVVLPPTSSMNTACWTYAEAGRGQPARHIITFGPKLAENQKAGDLGEYAAAYHRHELAHSLWTERDLKGLDEKCKTLGVPFAAMNIFEDARIEHKWREQFEEPFSWETFEGPRDDPKAADDIPKRCLAGLMALIQNEDQVGILDGRLADLPEREEVKDFYHQIISAPDTASLYPLLTAWKDKYGFPEGMDNPGNPGSAKATSGDMAAGAKAQESKKAMEELCSAEKASKEEEESERSGMGQLTSMTPAEHKRGEVLQRSSSHLIEQPRVDRIAGILRGAFNERERRYVRATPSKRMSMRHFMRESDRIYRAKAHDAPGKANLSVIVDCSGSMNGAPIDSGRHLVAALGQLAREGQIVGDMILTIGHDRTAYSQAVPLRAVTNEIAAMIPANGGFEGFDAAMRKHTGKLKGRSLVISYTDGHITDSPIQRSAWHAWGVYSVGCYVGDPKIADNLRKWFDAPLCRKDEASLALALRDMIAQRAREGVGTVDSGLEEDLAAPAPKVKPRRAVGV